MAARLPGNKDAGVRIRRPGRLREFLEDTAQAAGMAEGGLEGPDLAISAPGAERRKIVVVSTEPEFSLALVRQALGVAGRLGTEVVALSVGRPESDSTTGSTAAGHGAKARELFEMRARKSAAEFAEAARQEGLDFRHVLRFGRPADVVENECGRLRRVEFVLAVKEQRGRDGFHVSTPLFEVIG